MTMQADDIIKLLEEAFPDGQVTLQDLRGDGDHYAVKVVSSRFVGMTRIEQHKLVYEALGGRMGEQLHALSVTTGVKL